MQVASDMICLRVGVKLPAACCLLSRTVVSARRMAGAACREMAVGERHKNWFVHFTHANIS
jgi:hypothetical protein